MEHVINWLSERTYKFADALRATTYVTMNVSECSVSLLIKPIPAAKQE